MVRSVTVRRLLSLVGAAAVASMLNGAPSWAGQVEPTAPDGPTEVVLFQGCFDDPVSLSWEAPAFDGGSPLTGYVVYRLGLAVVEVGADTTTSGPLEEAGIQDFAVSARNAIGESEPTPVSTVATPGCIAPTTVESPTTEATHDPPPRPIRREPNFTG